MPSLPRGPIVYQCDGDDCMNKIESGRAEWWELLVPVHARQRRHYWFCSFEHLLPSLVEEGQGIVKAPSKQEEVKP